MPPTAPVCAAATRDCLENCDSENCEDSCVAADPAAVACDGCLDDAFAACANERGCQDEWDALVCCFEACKDKGAPDCDETCAGLDAVWESCAFASDAECEAAMEVCFAP